MCGSAGSVKSNHGVEVVSQGERLTPIVERRLETAVNARTAGEDIITVDGSSQQYPLHRNLSWYGPVLPSFYHSSTDVTFTFLEEQNYHNTT